jgi:hypothetical protein
MDRADGRNGCLIALLSDMHEMVGCNFQTAIRMGGQVEGSSPGGA